MSIASLTADPTSPGFACHVLKESLEFMLYMEITILTQVPRVLIEDQNTTLV
jgi:hypothetical protein